MRIQFIKLLKLKTILKGIGIAVIFVTLYSQSAFGQVIDGYVKVNAFERKVTPSQVFKGEKFQGILRGDATLVKDLPLNTNVEVDYVVKAKLDGGQPEEIVGKGTIKVGPLPSVKAGANVNLTETMDLLFPESARPGKYTLVIEAAGVRPFIIYMVADLVFPGLESMSLYLDQVQYLGEKPSPPNINPVPIAPKVESGVTNLNITLNAPGEAIATTSIDVNIQVQSPNMEKGSLFLYLQKGNEEKTLIKEVSIPGNVMLKESILTPDYSGNVTVIAELKDYYIGGQQIILPNPLVKTIDISLVRRPLQAAGKIDEKGVIKQTTQVASPDGNADIRLPTGTVALTADNHPVNELTITVNPSPPVDSERLIVGSAYNLEPSGARFEPPIRISIKYDKTQLDKDINENELAIAYFNPVSGWEKLPGSLDKNQQLVSADIGHFSLFAIVGEVAGFNYWLMGLIGAGIGILVIVILFFGIRILSRR